MLNSFESYKINEEVSDNFYVDTVYAKRQTVCGDEHDGLFGKGMRLASLKGPTTPNVIFSDGQHTSAVAVRTAIRSTSNVVSAKSKIFVPRRNAFHSNF